MPISARGTCKRRLTHLPLRGFTLIELMVVLVIVGIALGAVTVQLMPDDRGDLRTEAEQLALLLENAGLEARSSGVGMAWLPDAKGYQFWRRNEQGNWKPVEDGPFRFRAWREQTRVTGVAVDSEPLKFGERMLLSATGFSLPFEIGLEHGTARAAIKGSSTGSVSVNMEDNPNASLAPH